MSEETNKVKKLEEKIAKQPTNVQRIAVNQPSGTKLYCPDTDEEGGGGGLEPAFGV